MTMCIGIVCSQAQCGTVPEDAADKDGCKECEECPHDLQPEHMASPGEGSQKRPAHASRLARHVIFMGSISSGRLGDRLGSGVHGSLHRRLGCLALLRGGGQGRVWIRRSGGVYGLIEPFGGGAGAFAEYATETDRIHAQSLQDGAPEPGAAATEPRQRPAARVSAPWNVEPEPAAERNPGRFLKIEGLIHVAAESTWQ